MNKIVIITPDITFPAGVSNHYLGMQKYFSDDVIYSQYKTSECIHREYSKCPRFIRTALRFAFKFIDVFKYLFLIWKHNKPVVLLNPSLGKSALRRDGFFLWLAKSYGCKVAVFVHGWDKSYFNSLCAGSEKFSGAWKKADCFFVLANEFKDDLHKLGIKVPIYLTTTKVADELVSDVNNKIFEGVRNVLFLARITKEKGIYIAIDAFEVVKSHRKDISLTVVGMGPELQKAKDYVQAKVIRDVSFTGPLSGVDLRDAFVHSDLYILPTSHGEGMPTSVLEAMAFGLPVVTRPVGGLVDFFEDGKMGYLVESLDATDFAEKVLDLIEGIDKARAMSVYNWGYARQHFLASKVAKELELRLRGI